MTGIQGRKNVGPDMNASVYMVDAVHHPMCQVKHYAGYVVRIRVKVRG
jgi:hypothetical protein